MGRRSSIWGFRHGAGLILLALFQLCMGKTAPGQEEPIQPVADVFKVMELASDRKMDVLWPKFKVSEIPVLVFDGLNTYLFHSISSAEGFVQSDKDSAAWVYSGRHPQVRGNSIVRLGEKWMARLILEPPDPNTADRVVTREWYL